MTRIARLGIVAVALAGAVTLGCRNSEKCDTCGSGGYTAQPTYHSASSYPAPSAGAPSGAAIPQGSGASGF